ncbi:MAG: ABC transporter ATP-binding protein, partial [Actinomycetota bacterium]
LGEAQDAEVMDRLAALPSVERVDRLPAAGAGGPPPGAPGGAPAGSLAAFNGVPGKYRLFIAGEADALVAPVVGELHALGANLDGLNLGEPTLEDVFIHLTGRALR